jgi:aminotransferase
LARLVQSEFRVMTTACARVEGINLGQGICDTGVPEPAIRGAKQAMDFGINT